MAFHQLAMSQGGNLILQVSQCDVKPRHHFVGSGFAPVFYIGIDCLLEGIQPLGSGKPRGLPRAGGRVHRPGIAGLGRRPGIYIAVFTESLTQMRIALVFGNGTLALLAFQLSYPLRAPLVQNKAPKSRSLVLLFLTNVLNLGLFFKSFGCLDFFYQVFNGNSGHCGWLQCPPGAKLRGDSCDDRIVRGFEDVDKVIFAQKRVLDQYLGAHLFHFFINFPDSAGIGHQCLSSMVG